MDRSLPISEFRRRARCPAAVVGIVFLAMLVVGCAGPGLQTAEVTGTVTYKGAPAVGVFVQFEPPDGYRHGLPSARGVTDTAGRYYLVRPGNKRGAVVGANRVTVTVMGGEGEAVTMVPAEVLARASCEIEVKPGHNVHDISM